MLTIIKNNSYQIGTVYFTIKLQKILSIIRDSHVDFGGKI